MNTIQPFQRSMLHWLGLLCILCICISCYSLAEPVNSDSVYRDRPSISLQRAARILGGSAYIPADLPIEVDPSPTILDHTDSLPLLGIYYFDLAGKPALRLWERPCHPGWPCWGEKPPTTPDGIEWRSINLRSGGTVKAKVYSVQELGKYYAVETSTREYTWLIDLVIGSDQEGTLIQIYSTLSLTDTLAIIETLVPVP